MHRDNSHNKVTVPAQRHRWAWWLIGSGIVIIIISLSAIPLIGWYLSPGYYVPSNELSRTDAIVVISGGGSERLEHGIELYNDGIAPLLILSGAAREGDYSNAESMQNTAVNRYHVPPDAILTDEQSSNTYENAVDVMAIALERHVTSITLVTSAYHQRRAYLTFRSVFGDSFTIQNSPAHPSFWSPFSWMLDQKAMQLTFSECAKILWNIITGKLY